MKHTFVFESEMHTYENRTTYKEWQLAAKQKGEYLIGNYAYSTLFKTMANELKPVGVLRLASPIKRKFL